MIEHARVTRMRKLLAEAVPETPPAPGRFLGLQANSIVAGPLRRRALAKQVGLATRDYGLREDVDAYLAAADCASLAGLTLPQLLVLARWVEGVMDRMATACDCPDAPPAR
jgi:hypothetical protein